MNRRDLPKLAALSAIPASLLQVRSAWAADTIKLSCSASMSGPSAANGEFADLSMKLTMERYGKVLGRPLVYNVFDVEDKPATTVRKVQELAQRKNVCCLMGGVLLSGLFMMGKRAEKLSGVFTITAGADEITGKDCNRATFRWSVPTYGAIKHTVHPLIESMPKAKRQCTITP